MLRASCILGVRPKATWERQLDMRGRAWSGAPCLASIPRTRASGRPARSRWQTARPSCPPTPRSSRSFPTTAWLLSSIRPSSRRGRTPNRQASPAALVRLVPVPIRRTRAAALVRAPPLAWIFEWWLDGRRCRRRYRLGWPLGCRGGEYPQLARGQIQHAR